MAKASYTLMPFYPAGSKAWVEVCKLDERTTARVMSGYSRYLPSKRGSDEKFHFWLYREYGGAEVVMQNKRAMIRFVDEQFQMLFSLRWM